MAYSYPGYVAPTPYAQNPDIVGNFSKGYDFGQGIAQENTTEATINSDPFQAWLQSIGVRHGAGAPSAAPAAAPAAPQELPSNQLVTGSVDAANSATDPALAAYLKSVAQRESSGNQNAVNPTSGATGLFQFMPQTWAGLMKNYPQLGLTADGINDPQQQQVAAKALTVENAGALKQAGQPVNPTSLYLAHFLGAPQATNLLGQSDNTPAASVLPAQVIQQNPQIANMDVGALKAWAGTSGTTPQGGYQPPAQPDANGLPPVSVLRSLLLNPQTRDFGMKLIQSRVDPQAAATLASTEADANLKNSEAKMYANGGRPPSGMYYDSNGNLVARPIVAADGSAVGTTADGTVDPTAPGFWTKPAVAGLTQGAIYQQALANITSGTTPPQGRTGAGGAQNAAVANMMAALDPMGNIAANKMQGKALYQSLAQQQKYFDTTQRAFNTANDTLSSLQDFMSKNNINPSQFPDINNFNNFLKAKGLDPGSAGGYNAQIATLRAEYSQVLARGGVRSVETDNEAAKLIPDGLPPAALAKVASQIKVDGDNVVNDAQNQIVQITNQISGIAHGNGAPTAEGTQAPAPPPPQSGPPPGAPTKTIGDNTYWQDPQTGKWFL